MLAASQLVKDRYTIYLARDLGLQGRDAHALGHRVFCRMCESQTDSNA